MITNHFTHRDHSRTQFNSHSKAAWYPSDEIYSPDYYHLFLKKPPVCFKNKQIKKSLKTLSTLFANKGITVWLFGGGIYKKHPSDLDLFLSERSPAEIKALFRFLQHQQHPSQFPLHGYDLNYALVDSFRELLNYKNLHLTFFYQKENRNVIKITMDGFSVDFIVSTDTPFKHANEVDIAVGGAHFDVYNEIMHFFNEQSLNDFLNQKLNLLFATHAVGVLKRDPSILLRIIRASVSSKFSLSDEFKEFLHRYIHENKTIFLQMDAQRLYHDFKLFFFTGRACANINKLQKFQLFDQLFGSRYLVEISPSRKNLYLYLIKETALIIDENPSQYHPSLMYYVLHWSSIKNYAYKTPGFFDYMTRLSYPTIVIPRENPHQPTFLPKEVLTLELDKLNRLLLTQLEKKYQMEACFEIEQEPFIPEMSVDDETLTIFEDAVLKLGENADDNKVLPVLSVETDKMDKPVTPALPSKKTYLEMLTTNAQKSPVSLIHSPVIIPQTISTEQKKNTKRRKGTRINYSPSKVVTPDATQTLRFVDNLNSDGVREMNYLTTLKSGLSVQSLPDESKLTVITYELLCQNANHQFHSAFEPLQNAASSFETARKMEPERADAYYGLGNVAIKQAKKMADSVESCRRNLESIFSLKKKHTFLEKDFVYWQTHYNTQFKAMIEKYEAAHEFYNQALKKKSDHAETIVIQLSDISQAIKEHQTAHQTIHQVKNTPSSTKNNKKSKAGRQKPTVIVSEASSEKEQVPAPAPAPALEPVKKVITSNSKQSPDVDYLTLGYHEQNRGKVSDALVFYQLYLVTQQKQVPSSNQYEFFSNIAENLRNKIHIGRLGGSLLQNSEAHLIPLFNLVIKSYSDAIQYLPQGVFSHAHIRIAEIKFTLGNFADVISCLKKIIHCSPENRRYHHSTRMLHILLGAAYEKTKHYELAKACFECASDETQKADDLVNFLNVCKTARNSVKEMQLKIEQKKIITEQVTLAKLMDATRETHKANTRAETLASAAPLITIEYFYQARELNKTGSYDAAGAIYKIIIESHYKHLLAYQELIEIYRVQNRYTNGISLCDFLIELDEATYNREASNPNDLTYPIFRSNILFLRGTLHLNYASTLLSDQEKYAQELTQAFQDLSTLIHAYEISDGLSFQNSIVEITAQSYSLLGQQVWKCLASLRLSIHKKATNDESLGILNFITTQEEFAATYLKKAIQLTPDTHTTYMDLAALRKIQENIDEAKHLFQTAQIMLRTQAQCIATQSSDYWYEKFYQLATEVGQKNIHKLSRILFEVRFDNENEILELSSVTANDREWIAFSKAFYQEAINYAPLDTFQHAHVVLATIDFVQENYLSALATFEAILNQRQFKEADCSERVLLYCCGKIYETIEQYQSAGKCYEKARQKAPYESDDLESLKVYKDLAHQSLSRILIKIIKSKSTPAKTITVDNDMLRSVDNSSNEARRPASSSRDPGIWLKVQANCMAIDQNGSREQVAGRGDLKTRISARALNSTHNGLFTPSETFETSMSQTFDAQENSI